MGQTGYPIVDAAMRQLNHTEWMHNRLRMIVTKVPDTYIHKPWAWPDVRNVSYPDPIVDHKVEREVTLHLYKEAKDA